MGEADHPHALSALGSGVFVSSQAIDSAPAHAVVLGLRSAGVHVEHSPSNPLHTKDPRWSNWYEAGLPAALRRCSAFVIVLDEGWDSSTWMGAEADTALRSADPGLQLKAYFWNPLGVQVKALGMIGYLKNELPVDTAEAVRILVEATSRRTRG